METSKSNNQAVKNTEKQEKLKQEEENEEEDEEEIIELEDDSSSSSGFSCVIEESMEMHKDLVFSPGQIYSKFKIISQIQSKYFVVQDVQNSGILNEKLCMKIYDNYYLKKEDVNQGFNILQNEVFTQSLIEQNKFVVQFYEYFQLISPSVTALIFEYCPKRSLYELQQSKKDKLFTVEETISYLKQILIGISVLHRNHLIHNKIQLKNIMVGDQNQIKISNFSSTEQLKKENDFLTQKPIKILAESAPEIKLKKQYGIKSDIYSIGVITYQMIQGKLPFELEKAKSSVLTELSKNTNEKQYIQNPSPDQLKFELINNVSIPEYMQKLIKQMLHPLPDMRISWEDLYKQVQNFEKYYNQDDQSLNNTTGKEKKIGLISSPSHNNIRNKKLTLEQEIDKLYGQAIQNEFYLFRTKGYGTQKLKKEQSDMQKILKHTKQTTLDIWEFDYMEIFQNYCNGRKNNSSNNNNSELKNALKSYIKEEIYDNCILQYQLNLKDQSFTCIKKFEDAKEYKEEVQTIKKLQKEKKLSDLISHGHNFSEQGLKYQYSAGLCNLLEYSDSRVEAMIPWQSKELIYLFRFLLSTVLGFYEAGYFHSEIKSQNIIVEYNQKNGRLEFKIVNFNSVSQDWKEKPSFNSHIFGGGEIYASNSSITNINSQNVQKNQKQQQQQKKKEEEDNNQNSLNQIAQHTSFQPKIYFNTKDQRLHEELMDIITVFLEMCIKSYFQKDVMQKKHCQKQSTSNKKENNNNNNSSNLKDPISKNILLAYNLQENLIKEAKNPKYGQKQQKCNFYLNQIRQNIFKEHFRNENSFLFEEKVGISDKNNNSQKQMSQSECQQQSQILDEPKKNSINDVKNSNENIVQNSNNNNDNSSQQEKDENNGKNDSEQSNNNNTQLNKSSQPKFPLYKPKLSKSQFSSSNLNAFIDSEDENEEQDEDEGINDVKNNLNQKKIEEDVNEDIEIVSQKDIIMDKDLEKQNDDNNNNNICINGAIKDASKQTLQQSQSKKKKQRVSFDADLDLQNKLATVSNDDNKQKQSQQQQDQKKKKQEEEDKNNNNSNIDESFIHMVDTIQHILVPKLYTVQGLKDFLQRKDVFQDWQYNKLWDDYRVIDNILKNKLQMNNSPERFGSRTEIGNNEEIFNNNI